MTTGISNRPAIGSAFIAAIACSALLSAQTSSVQVQTPAAPPKVLPAVSANRRKAAEAAFLRGAKQLKEGAYLAAQQNFADAVQLNPSKDEYAAAMLVAREHAVTNFLQLAAIHSVTDRAVADQYVEEARRLDATNPRILQHDVQSVAAGHHMEREQRAAPVVTLQPNTSVHSYHERLDSKALTLKLAADYGLQAVFDPDLPSKLVRLDVENVRADEALRIVALLSNTMYVPLNEHSFLLTANTLENRQRYDRLVEETFNLPGYQTDQLKDFVSIAQQLLDIRQVSASPLGGTLVVRGPAERVAAFERVFADLLQGTNEVVLDIKLYAVDRSHVRNLGIVLPQSLNFFSLASEAQTVVSQNSALISQLVASGVLPANASTLEIAAYLVFVAGLGSSSLLQNSFLLLGGGLTTTAVSAGNIPTINLALTQSEARSLEDVQLRASDQQRAIFRSGTRYPIQTSLFSDIASSTATSLAGTTVNGVSLSSLLASYLGTSSTGSSAVIPQVQYEDLGLTVTATPVVQRTSDVTLKLEVKLSALAGAALNGIPILNSRQFSSDLTVRDGETMLMVSNTSRNETAAVSGEPGLSEIPGFQGTTNRNASETTGSLVLLITPHIVRHGHVQATGPYIPLAPRPGDE